MFSPFFSQKSLIQFATQLCLIGASISILGSDLSYTLKSIVTLKKFMHEEKPLLTYKNELLGQLGNALVAIHIND